MRITERGPTSGTLYFLLYDSTEKIWNSATFVTYDAGDYGEYGTVAPAVMVRPGRYTIDAPAGTAAYELVVQAGAIPAETDAVYAYGNVTAAAGAAGAGADSVTLTLTDADTADAVPDVDVWITTDAGGGSVYAGALQTAGDGTVTFLLDDGTTYHLWAQLAGYNPVQGTAFTADAGAGNAFTLTPATAVSTPSGEYATQTDIEDRYGTENVRKWSTLAPSATTTDTARTQKALDAADAKVHEYLRRRYNVPLSPLSALDAEILKGLAVSVAGYWLYSSRGMDEEDPTATRLQNDYDAALADLALYRAGVRRLDAGRLDGLTDLVPTTSLP